MRSRRPVRAVSQLTVVVVMLAAVEAWGCKKKPSAGADSDSAKAAAAPTPAAPVDSNGMRVQAEIGKTYTAAPESTSTVTANAAPGELQQSLDYYVAHPTAFVALRNTFGWSWTVRRRACDESIAGCKGPTPTRFTFASADAVSGARRIDLEKPLPTYGVIIGRLRSYGYWTERRYGIRPGPDEVYLVLRGGGAGTASLTLATLHFGGGGPSLSLKDASEHFRACDPHIDAPSDYGDYHYCPGTLVSKLAPPADGIDAELISPAWMPCAQGCCTSDYPPFATAQFRAKGK